MLARRMLSRKTILRAHEWYTSTGASSGLLCCWLLLLSAPPTAPSASPLLLAWKAKAPASKSPRLSSEDKEELRLKSLRSFTILQVCLFSVIDDENAVVRYLMQMDGVLVHAGCRMLFPPTTFALAGSPSHLHLLCVFNLQKARDQLQPEIETQDARWKEGSLRYDRSATAMSGSRTGIPIKMRTTLKRFIISQLVVLPL